MSVTGKLRKQKLKEEQMKEKKTRRQKADEELMLKQAFQYMNQPEFLVGKDTTLSEEDFHNRYFPEALEYVRTNPQHTMVRKMTRIQVAQMTKRGRSYEKFIESLTPEELEVWNRDMDYDGKMTGFKKVKNESMTDAYNMGKDAIANGQVRRGVRTKHAEKRAERLYNRMKAEDIAIENGEVIKEQANDETNLNVDDE